MIFLHFFLLAYLERKGTKNILSPQHNIKESKYITFLYYNTLQINKIKKYSKKTHFFFA